MIVFLKTIETKYEVAEIKEIKGNRKLKGIKDRWNLRLTRLEILESNSANFEMPREIWGTVKDPIWPTIFSRGHSKMEYKIYYIARIQNLKA